MATEARSDIPKETAPNKAFPGAIALIADIQARITYPRAFAYDNDFKNAYETNRLKLENSTHSFSPLQRAELREKLRAFIKNAFDWQKGLSRTNKDFGKRIRIIETIYGLNETPDDLSEIDSTLQLKSKAVEDYRRNCIATLASFADTEHNEGNGQDLWQEIQQMAGVN